MFTRRGTSVYFGDSFFLSCESVAQAQTYVTWAHIGYERGLGDGLARATTFATDVATMARQFTNHSPERPAQRDVGMASRNRSGDDTPADHGKSSGVQPSAPDVVIGGDFREVEGGRVVSLIGITEKGQIRIVDAKAC